jgi:uncharacterized protein YxeA
MKKIMSFVLTIALMMSMAVTAFATEDDGTSTSTTHTSVENETDSYNVQAKYTKPEDKVETVYYVTVEWKQTGKITYTDALDTYTWNATGKNELEYTKTSGNAEWSIGTDSDAPKVTIKVTNKSNHGIVAALEKADVEGIKVTGKFGNDKDKLSAGSAVNFTGHATGTKGSATTDETTYEITAVEGAITKDSTTIAKITVKISASTDSTSTDNDGTE